MNIFYIIGVIVVVLFIAGYFGFRQLRCLQDSDYHRCVTERKNINLRYMEKIVFYSTIFEAKNQDIPDCESLTILYSPLCKQDLRHVNPFAKGDTNDEKR